MRGLFDHFAIKCPLNQKAPGPFAGAPRKAQQCAKTLAPAFIKLPVRLTGCTHVPSATAMVTASTTATLHLSFPSQPLHPNFHCCLRHRLGRHRLNNFHYIRRTVFGQENYLHYQKGAAIGYRSIHHSEFTPKALRARTHSDVLLTAINNEIAAGYTVGPSSAPSLISNLLFLGWGQRETYHFAYYWTTVDLMATALTAQNLNNSFYYRMP